MKQIKVTLSGSLDQEYTAYTNGDDWNGFERPIFTKSEADRFVANWNEEYPDSEITYDEETGMYYQKDSENCPYDLDDYIDGCLEGRFVSSVADEEAFTDDGELTEEALEDYKSEYHERLADFDDEWFCPIGKLVSDVSIPDVDEPLFDFGGYLTWSNSEN